MRVGNGGGRGELASFAKEMIDWMSNEFGPSGTVRFAERNKRTLRDCISARLLGSAREEAGEWVEDLLVLNVAREDVLLLLTQPTLQTSRIQRQLEGFDL